MKNIASILFYKYSKQRFNFISQTSFSYRHNRNYLLQSGKIENFNKQVGKSIKEIASQRRS